jgi:hypothetical protein
MDSPEVTFQALVSTANAQQAKSLTALHEVLKKHKESGNANYSIAEIARLSVAGGGPSVSTIRNKTGQCFRELIQAWANQAGLPMKKPVNPKGRGTSVPKDNELLRKIPDAAVRGVFGMIIAERNRYRNELNLLKAHTEIIIDRRPGVSPNRPAPKAASNSEVQVISSITGLLNGMEVQALKAAVEDEFFEKQGWTVSKAGQVRGEDGEIYKHGYVNALRKLNRP